MSPSLSPSEDKRESGRERVRQHAPQHLKAANPTGWFEPVYAGANGDWEQVPWANAHPSPLISEALDTLTLPDGARGLVVGCGLGDDAEALAARGAQVTAFDVAPSAIAWCQQRFPNSEVDYQVADLFNLPPVWQSAFDVVVEVNTIQALPLNVRARALRCLAATLAQGGWLLLACWGRDDDAEVRHIPWPLSRADLRELEHSGLTLKDFQDVPGTADAPRRFRAVYRC